MDTVPRIYDQGEDHFAGARRAHQKAAAERAAAHEIKLHRAARVVRAGLEAGRLDVDDVVPEAVRRVVEAAPALSADEVDRLRGLLPPADLREAA